MTDIKTLESMMDKDTFYGEGQINLMHVDMEYSPGKYSFIATPPIIGSIVASSTDIFFNAPYAITSVSMGFAGGSSKHKLSALEIRAAMNSGSLVSYLWADPRYVLKFSKDIQPLLKDSYHMRIDDAYAKKMEQEAIKDPLTKAITPYVITAEMQFENDYIKKMILRAAMEDGSVTEEEEVNFTR